MQPELRFDPCETMFSVTHDQLWKAILEDLFDDFLRWFYTGYVHQIDFERPFEFLDQELLKIFPESQVTNRFVDKLVKVWLRDGTDSWFLLHVEAQSYPDTGFAGRMYTYYYRLWDLHQQNITALAIFADGQPGYKPELFQMDFMGTRLEYRFQTCKIMELNIRDLERSENPFALALATAWYGIRSKNQNDAARLTFKIQLVKNLLQRQIPRERIRRLLEFIKYYTKFDREEHYRDFEEIIHPNRGKMGIIELIQEEAKKYYEKVGLEAGLEAGLEVGLEKGREEGKEEAQKAVIEKLIQKGFTVEQVAELLDLSIAEIQRTLGQVSSPPLDAA